MKLKSLRVLIAIAAIFSLCLIPQSCSDNNGSTARVQLKLVDAPGDYLQVNVEIIDIQYNTTDSEDGWKSFTPTSGYPINVDLTELIAGNSLLLTDQIIPAGMLKQIRLVLSDNNTLLIDGEAEAIHLDTPSAMQSGLKLNLNTELEAGFSYTFILDWAVQQSVVEDGTTGMYNLKPVISVIADVNSGSIGGELAGDIPLAKSGIIVQVFTTDDVFVKSTETDDSGNFLIQGLAGGTYKLKIDQKDDPDGYQAYESADITVTVGEVYDVGPIELISL